MGRLVFYYGAMGSGKSTLALQMHYNLQEANKPGIALIMGDRSGEAAITNRIGMRSPAVLINPEKNILELLFDWIHDSGKLPEYIIADEIQFYSVEQIEQLAKIVDDWNVNVYCLGITTDFKSHLFDSVKRLFELADEKIELQLESLCWCGAKGIMHARTIDGYMVTEGEQKIVGDLDSKGFGYEVLCRKHFFKNMTKKANEDINER